jgi:hypothetical protein
MARILASLPLGAAASPGSRRLAGSLSLSSFLFLFFFNQPFSSFPSLLQSSTLCGRRRAPIAMRKKCAASRPPTALVSSFSVAFIYGGESSIFYFILKDFIKIFV